MIRTTIFSSATPDYELFVLPYMASVLIHNDDARVEVCLEESARFREANAHGIKVLLRHYGKNRFRVRDAVSSRGVSPNSVRFLETPEVMSEFTYIGDIDILILEGVSQRHIDRMSSAGLPYSNVLRPGRRALTGLHFTRSDAYYPVSPPADVDPNRDEELLHALVTSRGVPLPPGEWRRPVHGFHLSLNRTPLTRFVDGKRKPAWGADRSKKRFLAAYEALQRPPVWRALYPPLRQTLSDAARVPRSRIGGCVPGLSNESERAGHRAVDRPSAHQEHRRGLIDQPHRAVRPAHRFVPVQATEPQPTMESDGPSLNGLPGRNRSPSETSRWG